MNGRRMGTRGTERAARSEPGRLNRALRRMARNGYGEEARVIVDAVRHLRPLDGADTSEPRRVLLMALHRRGPFAPEWDFCTPRGLRRPVVG